MSSFSEMSYFLKYAKDYYIVEILACLSVIIYLFHTLILSKFTKRLPPGPIGLPLVGYLPFLGKKPYKVIADMRKKYGDIIGLKLGSKYAVFINEQTILKEFLSNPAALDSSTDVLKGLPLGFGSVNGAEWHEQRRFCLHLMRNLGIGRGPWETITRVSTCDFVKELRVSKGQPLEIANLLNTYLGCNIISLLLGRRLDPLTEKNKIEIASNFSNALDYFGPSVLGSIIPGYRKFCTYFRILGYDKAAEAIEKFYDLYRNEVEDRRKACNAGAEDFIHLYDEKIKQMQNQDISHFFNDKNLLGNMAILYLGGSDTVTISLGWLFRLMAKYPEIQKKVQDELDEVIGRDGAISFEDKHKVPYTFAVMQEAQRLSTLVPLSSMRKMPSDFEIGGYSIPKGSIVIGNMWAIHHDPDYWESPEEFRPERFIGKNRNGDSKDRGWLVTFSFGKRNCPGETVAWMVIINFFSTVMQKFTISPPPGVPINLDVIGGILERLKPQPLCFKERD